MAKNKVLVIDDEEDACWLVSTILQDNHFSVITAVTGTDGEKEFHEHTEEIGLVFLDLKLPDADGLLLCKTIREKNIPVVIMTAYGNETARKAAKEMGVVEFIDKPLKVERILEIAKEIVGQEVEEKAVHSPAPSQKVVRGGKLLAGVKNKVGARMPLKPGPAEEKKEPEHKKPAVSIKFIGFIIILLAAGSVFFKGKTIIDSAERYLLRGEHISAIEWYSKGLAINPWNKKAKEGLEKAKKLASEKPSKQMQGNENVYKELSEKKRQLGEKILEVSELEAKIRGLNQTVDSYKEKEEELTTKLKNETSKLVETGSKTEKLTEQNNALSKKIKELGEELAKFPHKIEVMNEEAQHFQETIAGLREKIAKRDEEIEELKPDAIRVRAVDEMKENIKEEREKLFREKMKFMKLENVRNVLKEREQTSFRAKEEMEREENTTEDMAAALNLIKMRDYDNACRILANILAADPDNEEVKELLDTIISVSTAEDTDRYLNKFLKSSNSREDDPSLKKALEYISRRRYQDAETELKRLIEKEPSNTIAAKLLLRVRVLRKLNES